MSDLSKYDVVDVQITSDRADCDAILDHPLLDGQKKYTLELTEFSAPLDAEHPMQLDLTGDSDMLFEFRRPRLVLITRPRVRDHATSVIEHFQGHNAKWASR